MAWPPSPLSRRYCCLWMQGCIEEILYIKLTAFRADSNNRQTRPCPGWMLSLCGAKVFPKVLGNKCGWRAEGIPLLPCGRQLGDWVQAGLVCLSESRRRRCRFGTCVPRRSTSTNSSSITQQEKIKGSEGSSQFTQKEQTKGRQKVKRAAVTTSSSSIKIAAAQCRQYDG